MSASELPDPPSDFVCDAIARMDATSPFFTDAQWELLSSYEGPVVSGDPKAAQLAQSEFIRDAAIRMQAMKPFFLTPEALQIFEPYDGPIVSGDPDGWTPKNERGVERE